MAKAELFAQFLWSSAQHMHAVQAGVDLGSHPNPVSQVHFIVASCENMVAGHGMRPGDVLTSAAGALCLVSCRPSDLGG